MARPSFKPTPALRRRVSIAAAAGMSHRDIAAGLGIAKGTLEKHFEHELSVGAIERRLEVLEALHKQAKGGNVSAAKALLAMPPSTDALLSAPTAEPARQSKAGKKEQRAADAHVAHENSPWDGIMKPPSLSQ